jgi:hypothetical protein
MPPTPVRSILCVASFFKGNRFIQRCHAEGCKVQLLTVEEMRRKPWAREAIAGFHVIPSVEKRDAVINAVARLMQDTPIDAVVALDDFDVELVAGLREHFRIPGMGETTVRYFRDKLAMRQKASENGILQPAFTSPLPTKRVRGFVERLPGPWLLKPRGSASAIGIKKLDTADQALLAIEQLGDQRSYHLLEQMVPGELYHVDSLVSEREVVFAQVARYHRPLLDVYQGGGVFGSRTLAPDAPEVAALGRLNALVLGHFGMVRGSSHTEFMRSKADGEFYFIETSARVGGAYLTEMVEAATGLNPWEEWASIELRPGTKHVPTPERREFGAVLVSLAKQERPDTSRFIDPEIVHRVEDPYHVGFVLRSASAARIEQLVNEYLQRIQRDFLAVLPPSEKATS